MEGGYSEFHAAYPSSCVGQGYTKMCDQPNDYSKIPDQAMHMFTYDKKKRSKIVSSKSGKFKIASSSFNY